MSERGALQLSVSLPGLPTLSVALSRLRTDIADWTTFWRDRFAPGFYRSILEDFVLEGGGSGRRWASLSPAYAAWKAARFPSTGILVRSGVLKASLAGPGAPFSIFRPGPTSLEVGTSVPYAMYHQLGTQRRGAATVARRRDYQYGAGQGMPARPPIRLTPAFMTVVGKQLQRFVQDAWTKRRQEFAADAKSGMGQGFFA